MTARAGLSLLWLVLAAALLTLVFSLYQNPLLEIYLASWALC